MTVPTNSGSTHLRLTVLIVIVACLFIALVARLWFLQVLQAPQATKTAYDNGVKLVYSPAPRGDILDRDGNILVGNVTEPVIEVEHQAAQNHPAMIGRLAALIGMTPKQLRQAIANLEYGPYAPVPVLPDATTQQILAIQENPQLYPGVTATTETVRTYTPMGVAAANIVGYVGQINAEQYKRLKKFGYRPQDQIGEAGVEASFESVLRGKPGIERVQTDSQGQVLGVLSDTPPQQGSNLRLSISGKLQVKAEGAIDQGLASARSKVDPVTKRPYMAPGGSVVVEDPRNGQILALATQPTFDPQQFVGGISYKHFDALRNNRDDPLEDRTIQGQYAPGSSFKLVTATAGLKYRVITPTSIFNDTGSIKIGNFIAHNDNSAAYGPIDLSTAITVSSDNYFNTIGIDLWDRRQHFGLTALQKIAYGYGFGRPTGIALPNEAPGFVPTPQSYVEFHKKYPKAYPQTQWYTGNSDQLAIGQDELLVTPLQLANAYATFANGGTLYRPQIALDAQTQSGKVVKVYGPQVRGPSPHLTPAERAAMINGFKGVVQNSQGTAAADFPASLASADIAGKTGTAQVNPPRQDTSVFTSFAPASHPEYVVDCFLEDSGYGAAAAAPVVRQLYQVLFHKKVQPVGYTTASGIGGQN